MPASGMGRRLPQSRPLWSPRGVRTTSSMPNWYASAAHARADAVSLQPWLCSHAVRRDASYPCRCPGSQALSSLAVSGKCASRQIVYIHAAGCLVKLVWTGCAQQYVGLYHEAEGSPAEAEAALTAAVATPYALQSGDYMASVAYMHCMQRGWQQRTPGK